MKEIAGYKWIMLALYSLGCLFNNFCFVAVTVIVQLLEDAFQVSVSDVNMISTIFMASYFAGALLFAFFSSRFNTRFCFWLGSFSNGFGALLRYVAILLPMSSRFSLFTVGTFFIGFASAFYLNFSTKIAVDWFSGEEIVFSTLIMSLSMTLGICIGAILASQTVSTESDLRAMLLILFIVGVVLFVATAVLARSRPSVAPSTTAQEMWDSDQSVESSLSVLRRQLSDYRGLLTNIKFLMILMVFAFLMTFLNGLVPVLDEIIPPCGYSGSIPGIGTALASGTGIISAPLVTPVLRFLRSRKLYLSLNLFLLLGLCLFFLSSLRPGSVATVLGSLSVLGFFITPALPVLAEVSIALTAPISPDLSAMMLYAAGQIGGVFITLGLTPAVESNVVTNCSSIVTPVAAIFLGVLLAPLIIIIALPLPKIEDGVIVKDDVSLDEHDESLRLLDHLESP